MDTTRHNVKLEAPSENEGTWATPEGHALTRVLDAGVSMDLVQRYVDVERRRNRRFLAVFGSLFLLVSLLVLVLFLAVSIHVLGNSRKATDVVADLQAQTAVYSAEILGVTSRLDEVETRSRDAVGRLSRAESERTREKRVLLTDLERFSKWVSDRNDRDGRAIAQMAARLKDLEELAESRQKALDDIRREYAALVSAGKFLIDTTPAPSDGGGGETAEAKTPDEPDTVLSTDARTIDDVDIESEVEASLADWRGRRVSEIRVVTFPGGDRYEGEFKNGLMHGWGVYVFRNGDRYEGEFRDDVKSGRGVMTHANGDRYVGQFGDDMRHGRGALTMKGGDKYVGEFHQGLMTGKGTLIARDGNKYSGDVRNGLKHGNGVFRFVNGDVYEGEFRDDARDGKGTYFFADGTKYIGEYRAGQRHGRGRYVYSGGEEYIGDFRNGKKEGEGVCVYPDGQRVRGLWKDDRMVRTLES